MDEKYRLALLKRRGINVSSTRVEFTGVIGVMDKLADKQNILKVVFAKEPLTGKPRNDKAFVEDAHIPKNIQDFILQNLESPVQPERGTTDYDLCLSLVRHPTESPLDYQNRLSQMVYDGESVIKASAKSVSKLKTKK